MSEITHHGVKGMKWGVRNDPKPSSRSASPQKSSSSKKLAGSQDDAAVALTQAALVASLVASQVALTTIDSGTARVMVNRGKRFISRSELAYKQKSSLAQKNLSDAELMKKVVKPINKDHPGFGTNMNCRRCTIAYEMRRRGYDVKATKSIQATGQTNRGMKKAVNAKIKAAQIAEHPVYTAKSMSQTKPTDAANALFKSLAKQPNGSRGEVGVMWMMGGGHSVAYEVRRGKPVIIDTQTGKMFKNSREWADNYQMSCWQAGFTRLDNKKINEKWVERWVKNND